MPFLLLPVLTHYMSPAEFGQVGVFQSLYTMFLAICGLGTSGAIVRQSYDADAEGVGVYIFNALLILIATSISLMVILWLGSELLSDWMKIQKQFFFYALLAAAMVFILNILLGQFQVAEKPLQYGVTQVGHSLLNISLSLVGIIIMSAGALGRIGGIVLAAVFFGIFALIILHAIGRMTYRINTGDMRSALRFGVPLLPHELGTFAVNWLSLFIINIKLDDKSVGLYLLAFQVSMVLGVLCDAFNRAYVPWLFSILKNEQPGYRIRVVKLTYIYFFMLAVVVSLSFLLSTWFVTFAFGANYAEASWMIGWLVLGQALGGAYLMVTNYIFYMRKTEGLSVISLIGNGINIILLLSLVPRFQLTGAIVAFVAARGMIFGMTWILANRLVPMPWGYYWSR